MRNIIEIIEELKEHPEFDAMDVCYELGAFVSRNNDKSSIENELNVDLYYPEYENTDNVDYAIFPSRQFELNGKFYSRCCGDICEKTVGDNTVEYIEVTDDKLLEILEKKL